MVRDLICVIKIIDEKFELCYFNITHFSLYYCSFTFALQIFQGLLGYVGDGNKYCTNLNTEYRLL